MSSFRSLFSLGGDRPPSGRTSPPNPRRASTKNDDLSWAEVDRGDNSSAPNVAGSFGQARGDVHIDLHQVENPFTLGGRGAGNGGTPVMRYQPTQQVGYWEQPHRDRPSHRQHNQRQRRIIWEWPPPLLNGGLGTTAHKAWNCDGNKGWRETKPKSHNSKRLQEPSRNLRLTCS
jgi:hypothetical protein